MIIFNDCVLLLLCVMIHGNFFSERVGDLLNSLLEFRDRTVILQLALCLFLMMRMWSSFAIDISLLYAFPLLLSDGFQTTLSPAVRIMPLKI